MGAIMLPVSHWLLPFQFRVTAIWVFAAIVAICYGFELFSKFTGWGYYELMDAYAGIIGGVIGMAIATIIMQYSGN